MRDRIIFYLNGKKREVGPELAGMMLADYLRYEESMTGTKIVCAEGDCGACTVLRWYPWSATRKKVLFLPVNSCISTIAQMDGSNLVTVDELKDLPSLQPSSTPPEFGPHLDPSFTPVQTAMMNCHGSQCGYCTPGFVMALTGLVEKKLSLPDKPSNQLTTQEVKNALTGNLCRCTGYQPIIDAALSIDLSQCKSVQNRCMSREQKIDLEKTVAQPVLLKNGRFTFFAPTTLKALTAYLSKNPNAKMIAAGTDLGVLQNKRKTEYSNWVSLHLIPQLYSVQFKKSGRVLVGARVTLSELRDAIRNKIPEFARFLDLFASPQIKNVATLVGNVGNASPIADTPPFLLVAGATVHVLGHQGKRSISIEEFYQGYRKTALGKGEVITGIEFDVPKKKESLALYKISQRKDLDISTVNAAYRVSWRASKRGTEKRQIDSIRIAMGGVAAIPLRLKKTETALQGVELNSDTLARALMILHSEMTPISDLRGSAAFRRVIVENLTRRFFSNQQDDLFN